VQLAEIKTRLEEAVKVHVEIWDPNMPARERVQKMEDYMHLTAYWRGLLEEAMYWLVESEKLLKGTWDDVKGWEPLLPKDQKSKPTQDAIRHAKKQIDRATHDAIQDCKALKESVGRQIRRFELDYETLSRVYSLMSGR
jgi:hypothetical protein